MLEPSRIAASNKQADMALSSASPPSSPSTAAVLILRAGTQLKQRQSRRGRSRTNSSLSPSCFQSVVGGWFSLEFMGSLAKPIDTIPPRETQSRGEIKTMSQVWWHSSPRGRDHRAPYSTAAAQQVAVLVLQCFSFRCF